MDQRTTPIEIWYRRFGKISVGVVLFLILVGGIVRSTGSGMGCPDWPKCFGLLVPPTDVSEIPASFFVNHPEYESQVFNATQTWIEYINRLIGALTGLVVFVTAVLSLGFFRKDKRIFFLSFAAMVLTGVEAWLGKLVVDQNLEGGMVTIHMFGALLILATLITAVYLASAGKASAKENSSFSATAVWLGLGVVLLTMAQVLIGTQVREGVDAVASQLSPGDRGAWLGQLGMSYSIHKVLWILVSVGIVWWVRELWTPGPGKTVRLFAGVLLGALGMEVLFGMLLSYFSLPPALQPLHLLLASIMFAAEYALFIHVVGLERLGVGKAHRGRKVSSLVNAD